jgi:hypothetical protein
VGEFVLNTSVKPVLYLVEPEVLLGNAGAACDKKINSFIPAKKFLDEVGHSPIQRGTGKSNFFIIDEPLLWNDASQSKDFSNVVVRVAINARINRLQVASCFPGMSDKVKELFVSYLVDRASAERVDLKIPADMSKFYKLFGAAPGNMTAEDRDELMEDHKPFSEGWLYNEKRLHQEKYDPSVLMNDKRIFFEGDKTALTNDCLIHALNYAIRWPWFTSRE